MRWLAILTCSVALACSGTKGGDETEAGSSGEGESGTTAEDATSGSETGEADDGEATDEAGDDTDEVGEESGDEVGEESGDEETTGGSQCHVGPCDETEWCDWELDNCGEFGEGACVPRPDGCDDIWLPVCGCDGVTYGNECEAQSAGVDISHWTPCDEMPGFFRCGAMWCDAASQYCELQVSDVGGLPDIYQCLPLPDDCTSCSCLSEVPCGGMCTEEDGGPLVTCPGG